MAQVNKLVKDQLLKAAQISALAAKEGEIVTPADILKNTLTKKASIIRNYLAKDGQDVSLIHRQPIEEAAAKVQASLLDKVRTKVQEREKSLINNAPVIDNSGAPIKASQVPLSEAQNRGVMYGGGMNEAPAGVPPEGVWQTQTNQPGQGAENTAANAEKAPEIFEEPQILTTKRATDGGGYFTMNNGRFIYWGSGLVRAEDMLDEILSEEKEANGFDPNPDGFLGDIVGAIAKVGQAALVKINNKREEQGKKPILKILEPNGGRETTLSTSENGTSSDSVLDAVRREAAAQLDAYKEKEKSNEIKKMLPGIIIGVVVLIVIVALIARRK